MRIAVVSDDQINVCRHFGRARYYIVFTVVDGEIKEREVRAKAGHHDFAKEGAHHEHHHDHHEEHGEGFGAHADHKHARMVASILDCEVVLVGGMGAGARISLQEAGITPHGTHKENAEEAVKDFLEGAEAPAPECRA